MGEEIAELCNAVSALALVIHETAWTHREVRIEPVRAARVSVCELKQGDREGQRQRGRDMREGEGKEW